ncbi:putative E3 ubiquitin-protein ligase RNF144A-B [Carex littledalei]|uniref:RBR-type E3 ubiquitin transferase n=1 Tax=Carex littledalei TaxID=544730 RepID=A0A833RHC1_9POAL|nr:putative E3 ubiquitin-protein ligase RNF144A-B [Carex littledalei]
MARTRASTSIENPRSRAKRPRLERGEQSREVTSDCKGKRREEGGGGGGEGNFVIDSDNDVRSGADDVLLSEELQKLERGEQSREETSDRKGKRKEEGGYEGIIVIDSDDDMLLSSEELQIQEILFMTMQSEKEREDFPLGTEQEQGSDISKPDPTDRKGKQPAKSHNRVTRAKFLCQICMEQVSEIQSFHINPCNHIFCNSCIVNYITSKLDGSNAIIPCPHPGCKSGFLDPLTCQHILPVDTFDKWGRVLCESSLGRNKFYCPFKDCSALLVDDEGGEEVRNCECPHCNRMFCAKCKVPWHGDMSCKEFQRLGKDERGQEDLMLRKLAKDKRWQRCPQCRMYVEKIDGCMFMKCRCGYCFCYVCATPMSKETHYCTKCKR